MWADSDRIRGNTFKLQDRYILDVRQKFFTLRVVMPRNRGLGTR